MGRYWQQDQFRSSFAPPNGREISFGVVRLVDLRLNALYLVRKPTLKEKAPLDWGFRGQISRFYYSETRLAANASEKTTPKLVWLPTGLSRLLAVSGDDFKYFELVSLPGFLRRAYQGLPMFRRLATWGRGGGAISWLCLSQQDPEPTLSTGVSATVVNMLSNKLRVCVVLGVCVLWRRPSRAAMDAAHSQPREMRSPACGYRLLGQTNCRQLMGCHQQGHLRRCDQAALLCLHKLSCPVELLNLALQLAQLF